ncbi:MAG: hypothetical protein RBS55_13010, partial [Bacteroidales bacterium]|nr:hypothetical protein [Bacteroidales bacterium]
MNSGKKITISLLILVISNFASGQLSGIKTIPGKYETIAEAVADLNTEGVGSGGVTFNVAAGHIESSSDPIIITATGTALNPIIFMKSGSGSNPLVKRTGSGTLATTAAGGQGDAIIRLEGTDYFTWDQIDLAATNQGIEYGFLTHKPDGTNGSQNLNILNSSITMNKGTSGFVTGIYISNGPASLSSDEGVTVTGSSGRNSGIIINGNTISNVHTGIYCRGSGTSGYPDENISVGAAGDNNYFMNFGGGNTSAANAIHLKYVDNPAVTYNDIDNQGGGGSSHGGPLTMIRFQNVAGTVVCSNNAITASNNSTSSDVEYIYVSNLVSSIYIEGNIFAAYTLSTTGNLYFIRTSGCTDYSSVSGNGTFGPITHGGGSTYGFSNSFTQSECTEIIYGNSFTDITVSSGFGILIGISSLSGVDSYQECDQNFISDLVHNGGGVVYGISLSGASNQVTGNIVQNLSGTSDIRGLSCSGTPNDIFNNTVKNLTTTGAGLYGIFCSGDITTYCHRNQVYNLASTYANPTVNGIRLAAGLFIHAYNNFISDLRAPSANAFIPVAGIYASSGTNVSLFYNTIYLDAVSSGAMFGTAGIYVSTIPLVDMCNNNIVNLSTPNGTSGYTAAYWRTNATLNTYSTNSNCNNFYAGIPGPNRLIFFDGTNALQTLDDYKSFVNTRDGASITENPPFINVASTPYNLHLQASMPTQCESGGMPVTSPVNVTNDLDGHSRNAGTPDIGADEFSGIITDLVPPAIVLTPLKNTTNTGNRILSATIGDASGVPSSGSGLPMLYWRVNGGAYTGVQATYVSDSRYDFTFGGGVAVNDVVEYFLVAQDLSGTPKVGPNPWAGATGFTTSPPACSTPPSAPYTYNIVAAMNGMVTVGTGGDFPSLTGKGGLFAGINARVVTGNITALIISDLTEDGTYGLNPWLEEGAGNYSLTIRPDGTIIRNINGSYGDGLIRLNETDRVTIDGRFNESGRYLNFSNSSTATSNAVFHIISDSYGESAADNVIRNCIISGGSNTVTTVYGIYAGG